MVAGASSEGGLAEKTAVLSAAAASCTARPLASKKHFLPSNQDVTYREVCLRQYGRIHL